MVEYVLGVSPNKMESSNSMSRMKSFVSTPKWTLKDHTKYIFVGGGGCWFASVR